jgi:hypothetical protein
MVKLQPILDCSILLQSLLRKRLNSQFEAPPLIPSMSRSKSIDAYQRRSKDMDSMSTRKRDTRNLQRIAEY